MPDINPGFIMIAGALLVPLIANTTIRSLYILGLTIVMFLMVVGFEPGQHGHVSIFNVDLVLLRVDKLSQVFGYIFLIATAIATIYAFHVEDRLQHTMGLMYAGASVAAVFAGDLVTLLVGWEITALSSVFLIWAARNDRALASGMRYLVIQVMSGVILLAGISFYYRETGSVAFNDIGITTLAGQIILLAIGIKCAFPLLHTWLADSYPESTVTGSVFLSIFTTKLAIYALARGFSGVELLIPIGVVMAIVPMFYALAENDLRRTLAYSLNHQLGFMVVGIGIGTSLAVNGAIAHAFASVIYKALLFMAVGAVLFRTGSAKVTDLGGLYRSMPKTAAYAVIGAATISAMPLLAGFTTKSLTLSAAVHEGHFWAWLALLVASAGAVVHTGIKIPYYAFFGRDSGIRCEEAPTNMRLAMAMAAGLCILFGVWPSLLYKLLPFDVSYQPYTVEHVATQLQVIVFAVLAVVLAAYLGFYRAPRAVVLLDVDWIYRKLGYEFATTLIILAGDAVRYTSDFGRRMFSMLERRLHFHHNPESGLLGRALPTGAMAFWATVMLGGYLLMFYFR